MSPREPLDRWATSLPDWSIEPEDGAWRIRCQRPQGDQLCGWTRLTIHRETVELLIAMHRFDHDLLDAVRRRVDRRGH